MGGSVERHPDGTLLGSGETHSSPYSAALHTFVQSVPVF